MHTPTDSQRKAIESEDSSLLVLAGPGSGKTFCLIERIRFLIDKRKVDPARICAFTFTNKAAGEIAARLDRLEGGAGEKVMRSTIHAYCADLLRKEPGAVGLKPGFGIADTDYQKSVLRRLGVYEKLRQYKLTDFSRHKMRGDDLDSRDKRTFEQYTAFLRDRNMVDFDDLVLKAAELLKTGAGPEIRARWDVILVDEFQDLDPVKYGFINDLARGHAQVFAVGDDEQSIYSWAGAKPAVFVDFLNDFGITSKVLLEENHRCPREVYDYARVLIARNTPIFENRAAPVAQKQSGFPVVARLFEDEDAELEWLVGDLQSERNSSGRDWGDFALLYRRNEMGQSLEAALVNAGIPCRLAQSRSLAEDPTVAYLMAALRVIQSPDDPVFRDAFFAQVLLQGLFNDAWAKAESTGTMLQSQLNHMAAQLPREHPDAQKIRRALSVHKNLRAVAQQYGTIDGLIQELLSQRIGRSPSSFEEHHDEISDPLGLPEVVKMANTLKLARDSGTAIWIGESGGAELALKNLLGAMGCTRVHAGGSPPPGALRLLPEAYAAVGIPLSVFKAAQILAMEDFSFTERNFTAVDIEATHKQTDRAETVEIGGVRVRDGRIVEQFSELVRPAIPIPESSTKIHKISDSDVAGARSFAEVWPEFREFCGRDVIMAHNGHGFDFPVLSRQAHEADLEFDLCPYDTLPLVRDLYPTSGKLEDLAVQFGVDPGNHRALADSICLAHVYLRLHDEKVSRARKTACQNLLQHLGIALALCDEATLGKEALLFLSMSRPYVFGRYSHSLEDYDEERGDDGSIPSAEAVIQKLGGRELMARIRAEKTAVDRYPAAMRRLGMLIREIPDGPLAQQLSVLMERIALSKQDGTESLSDRVNLLTLHSTKGLEFSRVYIVGTETSEFPGSGKGGQEHSVHETEESRRLLYVGMTRTKDRLVMTCVRARGDKEGRGHQFLDEMGVVPI